MMDIPAALRLQCLLCSLLLLVLPIAAVEGNPANCSVFETNGTAAAQFNYYRFYDFRNISSREWNQDKSLRSPDNVTVGTSTNDMSWQLDWMRRDLRREPPSNLSYFLMPIDYQPDKVQIKNVDDSPDSDSLTALTLLSSRKSDKAHQSSGIEFNDRSIHHISLRVYARITGAPGACAAFFTYENDTQEADIELLTRNEPDVIGFNTQPSIYSNGTKIPNAHFNTTMPGDLTRETWIRYRMDWIEDHVAWYVNGELLANTSTNVPVEPSKLVISLWGNGGSWTGNMTLGESALLEVQWIEMAFNLSDATPTERGDSVCYLDKGETEDSWEPYIFPPPEESGANRHCLPILLVLGLLAFLL